MASAPAAVSRFALGGRVGLAGFEGVGFGVGRGVGEAVAKGAVVVGSLECVGGNFAAG